MSIPSIYNSMKYVGKNKRLVWIDIAKGIGIFLMVFAHTERGLVSSSILQESFFIALLDGWIYAFHMPLFFFISGLLADRAVQSEVVPWVNKMLRTIVYPYFIWSILQTLLQMAASNLVNREISTPQLWAIIYQPVQQFWFLYALFMVMLTYFVSHKLGLSNSIFVVIAVLLYLCQVWGISFGSWGMLYIFRRYLIYFTVGVVVGRESISLLGNRLKTIGLSIFCLVLFGLVTIAAYFNWGGEYTLAFPFIALCGIAATIALAFVCQQFDSAAFLEQWGKVTLQIYLVHTIASAVTRLVLQKVGINNPAIHLILGTTVGLYVPIYLVKYSQKFRLRYLFAIPKRSTT